MTDKAPERIWALVSSVWNGWYQNISHKGPTREFPVTEYVRADLLEAAQARIAELEARFRSTVGMVADATKILTDTHSRSDAEILAEALEEAAVKAEREGVYPELNVWDGGPDWYKHGKRIAAAIRALKEKPNG